MKKSKKWTEIRDSEYLKNPKFILHADFRNLHSFLLTYHVRHNSIVYLHSVNEKKERDNALSMAFEFYLVTHTILPYYRL